MPVPTAPPGYAAPPGYKLVPIPEMPKPRKSAVADPADNDRKIFVGGLSPATTEISLVKYFSSFGPVEDATVVREANKSRGFGFVQFRDGIPSDILEKKHIIDQRRCGISIAVPRNVEH
jgi:RNA recognition motif-containing protein